MAVIFHAKYLNRYFFLLKNREKLENYKLKNFLLKLPTKWTFPISWSPLFSITDSSKKKKKENMEWFIQAMATVSVRTGSAYLRRHVGLGANFSKRANNILFLINETSSRAWMKI